jgi:ribosomal protein S3
MFDTLSVKGIKIRLKGKISAAGNSRKRTILFRSGKNSYSSVNIKCIHDFKTITTFTGVMGFQVWLFY